MDGDVVRAGPTVELSVAAACGAKLAQVGAAAVELLHVVVAPIRRPEIAAGVEGQAGHVLELSVAGAYGAELAEVGAAAVELHHPGVVLVRHPEIAAAVEGEG